MFVERGLDGPFFVAQDSTSALQRNCKPEKFGVDDAQIDRAIRSLEEGHRTKDKEQHFWLKFKVHYATSVAAMILCFNINIFTDMAVFWSGYVAFALGPISIRALYRCSFCTSVCRDYSGAIS